MKSPTKWKTSLRYLVFYQCNEQTPINFNEHTKPYSLSISYANNKALSLQFVQIIFGMLLGNAK